MCVGYCMSCGTFTHHLATEFAGGSLGRWRKGRKDGNSFNMMRTKTRLHGKNAQSCSIYTSIIYYTVIRYIFWCKHTLTLLWPLLGKWSILTRKYFSGGLVQAPSSNLHNQYCEDPATLHPMEASSEVAKASKVDRPGAERKASMCGMDSYRMCRW